MKAAMAHSADSGDPRNCAGTLRDQLGFRRIAPGTCAAGSVPRNRARNPVRPAVFRGIIVGNPGGRCHSAKSRPQPGRPPRIPRNRARHLRGRLCSAGSLSAHCMASSDSAEPRAAPCAAGSDSAESSSEHGGSSTLAADRASMAYRKCTWPGGPPLTAKGPGLDQSNESSLAGDCDLDAVGARPPSDVPPSAPPAR